ncbi:DUF4917 family protein [Mycobacterium sp. TNTM28]|uniref:DUF4917 family protein n=1 Tax=[Mycobacterium] fortunisiensis TaxID=2600579 RepID=A0ABS6KFC4_9MYCO|nr:DUF4917 family protein [[Mycobacterium] fortunisiensis]MBU9762246.1 DUF4917 family protein [[Mycobacterium] fortunisiensis]
MPVIEDLRDWADLASDPWPTLLIGNGMSINTWHKFDYSELRAHAVFESAVDQLFTDWNTSNFEEVLEGLWHAERVLTAMKENSEGVRALYEHVRQELVEAIQRVHIRWNSLPMKNLQRVAEVLDQHNLAFTLNYDLLTYWALMYNQGSTEIVDFFWNNPFDPLDTEIHSATATGLLFLHGGIHLWHDSVTGETGKWTNQQQGGLLSQLGDALEANPNRQPLIVSEGRHAQKLRAIRRSDYLSFAYRRLSENHDATVIFGASFGPQDEHIVSALRAEGRRNIAISILPGNENKMVTAMAEYKAKLPDQNLLFFKSTTHPLGDPALLVSDV